MRGDSIVLTLEGSRMEMTAGELDEHLALLASLRAKMSEAIPADPPPIGEVVVNPSYRIRIDRNSKASLLRLRHEGYGWLNFEISPGEALNMKNIWNSVVEKLELEDPRMAIVPGDDDPPPLH